MTVHNNLSFVVGVFCLIVSFFVWNTSPNLAMLNVIMGMLNLAFAFGLIKPHTCECDEAEDGLKTKK